MKKGKSTKKRRIGKGMTTRPGDEIVYETPEFLPNITRAELEEMRRFFYLEDVEYGYPAVQFFEDLAS